MIRFDSFTPNIQSIHNIDADPRDDFQTELFWIHLQLQSNHNNESRTCQNGSIYLTINQSFEHSIFQSLSLKCVWFDIFNFISTWVLYWIQFSIGLWFHEWYGLDKTKFRYSNEYRSGFNWYWNNQRIPSLLR